MTEFKVELPRDLRQTAGRGQLSPVTHALVAVAVPANFDATREWPVMIISATSDPQYHSSRLLLGAYADTAVAAGWILMAADPAEDVSVDQDDVPLRYALNTAALPALKLQWPGADKAPLAFGGFSGGAKYSGWLAAGFASQGESDAISTPSEHRAVHDELNRAGFRNVQIEYFPGPHEIEPAPLRTALDWFHEVAAHAAAAT